MKIFFKNLSLTVFVIVLSSFVLTTSAGAVGTDGTVKDVQTIIRTIGFLENTATDGVMAIVYDPESKASLAQARRMEGMIKKEKSGLQPRLVSVSALSGLQNARFAFVTNGLESHYNQLSTALQNNKILSFTLNRDCMLENCCTIYINSQNRVEIVINKAIADRIQARFKPVFLMMVTVI